MKHETPGREQKHETPGHEQTPCKTTPHRRKHNPFSQWVLQAVIDWVVSWSKRYDQLVSALECCQYSGDSARRNICKSFVDKISTQRYYCRTPRETDVSVKCSVWLHTRHCILSICLLFCLRINKIDSVLTGRMSLNNCTHHSQCDTHDLIFKILFTCSC